MSNVTLLYVVNQFDKNGTLSSYNPENNETKFIGMVGVNECGAMINHWATQFSTNSLTLIGDNVPYLEGIKDIILADYATRYADQKIIINIISNTLFD